MADVWLNDVWSVYFHDPADPSWTLDSYQRLGDVATVGDLWRMQLSIEPFVKSGMFFVMREHVFPCWDDKSNIEGGCVSVKVAARSAPAAWELLFKRAVGETLMADDDVWDALNGLSISPKRGFCILKLWLRDLASCTPDCFRPPPGYDGEVVVKSNIDNMQTYRQSSQARAPEARALRTLAGERAPGRPGIQGEPGRPGIQGEPGRTPGIQGEPGRSSSENTPQVA
jgi:hypothetical protein